MTLAEPESLLAALVALPDGLEVAGADTAVTLAQLESRGYSFVNDPDGRVRLACARAHFDPQRFVEARRGTFAREFEVWESLASTNERAWDLVRTGSATGTMVLTEWQEKGRGRQGRRWDCPPHSGLLFSLLLEGDLEQSERPQLLPLALGAGVAEALRATTGLDVGLKWPNDILCAGQKCGGVLVEVRRPGNGVVVGCGLNVHTDGAWFTARGLPGAGSLPGAPTLAREVLLARVLDGIEAGYHDWSARRWEDVLQHWRALDVLHGRMVELESAGRSIRGRSCGITPAGMLALEREDGGIEAYSAGEVHLR